MSLYLPVSALTTVLCLVTEGCVEVGGASVVHSTGGPHFCSDPGEWHCGDYAV